MDIGVLVRLVISARIFLLLTYWFWKILKAECGTLCCFTCMPFTGIMLVVEMMKLYVLVYILYFLNALNVERLMKSSVVQI